MKRSTLKATLLLTLLASATLHADTLHLNGGDRISGKIISLQGDSIKFETDYAGTLTIKKSAVAKMESETPLLARTDPKAKDSVNITPQPDGTFTLISKEEKDALSLSTVSTLWKPGAEDPDFPKIKRWSYSAALGFGGRSGNTDTFAVNLALDAVYSGEKDTLRIYGKGAYEHTDGSLVTQTITAGLDYEYRICPVSSFYLRNELTQNKIQGIDLRNVAAAGYGRYFWQKKKGDAITDMLRLRLGLGHAYTKYADQDNTSDITLDTGLRFRALVHDNIIWNTEITYTPAFDDFGDYYAHHETTLEFPLEFLKITQEVGVSNDYASKPDPGTEKLDTVWFIRFKKTW